MFLRLSVGLFPVGVIDPSVKSPLFPLRSFNVFLDSTFGDFT
jgi:hypothetical protein